MFKPTIKTIKKMDKLPQILASLEKAQDKDILIGIPQQKASREGDGPTNAELAYLHEHGDPAHNIPPRAFLQPSMEANKMTIADKMGGVINSALSGDTAGVENKMEALSLYGANKAKAWFVDPQNNWPANAPSTIKRKGSDKPLIDTQGMRKAISGVVRNKKK